MGGVLFDDNLLPQRLQASPPTKEELYRQLGVLSWICCYFGHEMRRVYPHKSTGKRDAADSVTVIELMNMSPHLRQRPPSGLKRKYRPKSAIAVTAEARARARLPPPSRCLLMPADCRSDLSVRTGTAWSVPKCAANGQSPLPVFDRASRAGRAMKPHREYRRQPKDRLLQA
ncbi:MAG: hypothetical protein M2R46_00314 [Verrucomicrobia subdivision 3 bacterium]|nr:hypothetical protein [Limisphaerales bacterium]